MSVYFVERSNDRAIKIGFSFDPFSRLDGLARTQDGDLKLLGIVDGGRPEEQAFHQRFSDCRLKGEWFRPESTLTAFIASLPSPPVDRSEMRALNHSRIIQRRRLTLRLPPELLARMRKAAGKLYAPSMTEIVERGIILALRELERKKK